jgi:5-(carboxyamino)imidazole ribonucleotide mutase/phosphoribosylaminoimidazole-succinocarboxamide synthase
LAQYEASGQVGAYITVAGRSNALSGMVDANVTAPVIACPPYSEKFGGADIYSSMRMPSGVAPALVLEPKGAALLVAKILGLADDDVRACVRSHQRANVEALLVADRELAGQK